MNKEQFLPDFLIIGAGKAGTTSLNQYLDQHPEIFMSPRKEPNFFAYMDASVSDFELPEQISYYKESVLTWNDYFKLFESAKPDQKKGENSNTYLYYPGSAKRIFACIPTVKIIAVLRNPVDRLFSRYMHLAREEQVPTAFEACLNRNSIWWQRDDLVNEGFYYKHLKEYYKLFPEDQIKVILYDDFTKNPFSVIKSIFNFLEVDEDFEPDMDIQFNKSGVIRNKYVKSIFGKRGLLNNQVKKIFPGLHQWFKNNPRVNHIYYSILKKILHKPKLPDELRSRIIQDIYFDDVRNLEKLLNADLKNWYSEL